MSYIHFDKTLMTNLEESLQKEILRSNRSGAYSCSTIVDCNTRKYHGLLVVPIPELGDENYVLLSSLDETVVQHGAEFNLGLHKYQGNNFSPNGHKYIREFNCDQVPTTIYRVGGVVLKKEKVFQHYENRIIIRYTLLDAHSETTLKLRPFLAFRCVREYTHENSRVNRNCQEVSNGIKTCMYEGYPELYMQLNKKNDFVFQPDWYRGVEYPKELERGYAFNEDLYVPGYFEFKIKKGESVVFSAGLSEIKTTQLKQIADFEVKIRTPRDNFYHCLVNSAHQFYYHVDGVFDRKSHSNRKEAEFIVDLIYQNIERYPDRSLGVVAFSVAQQDLTLDVAEVDARLLLEGGDLLFVRLFGALCNVLDGDVVIPLIELFLRHIVGAFGKKPLFERAVEIVHVPLGRFDVGVDRRAHGAFHIVGDVF